MLVNEGWSTVEGPSTNTVNPLGPKPPQAATSSYKQLQASTFEDSDDLRTLIAMTQL